MTTRRSDKPRPYFSHFFSLSCHGDIMFRFSRETRAEFIYTSRNLGIAIVALRQYKSKHATVMWLLFDCQEWKCVGEDKFERYLIETMRYLF